jgi:hypothetical protein
MDYIWTFACFAASNKLQQTAAECLSNRYFGDVHDTNPASHPKADQHFTGAVRCANEFDAKSPLLVSDRIPDSRLTA